ncbi:MAG: methyltransferase domain-containing protein, partial [Bacteroidales bacterium]|nr:methyltransferase domain-containing protein [Bacteroidales bacterium]
MLQIAESRISETDLSIKMTEGNIEETPFNDHEFDLIFAEGGVISLTPDPEQMMKEFKRITKPGGYIWIDYLNLHGWALLQPDIENRSKLAEQEEETIYMGKHEIPFRLFAPKRIRYMLYDSGFLELNEFGNGIISNPLKEDHEFEHADLDLIKESELALSRNYIMTGAAFHIQVLAQKIIH